MCGSESGQLGGRGSLPRRDGQGEDSVPDCEGSQPGHPGAQGLVFQVALGDTVGGELPEEAFGHRLAGHFDAVNHEVDFAAREFGGGDHGAIEVAEAALGGAAAQREGNVDVEHAVPDGVDREGLAELLEFPEGGKGQIDFFGRQAEAGGPLPALFGGEGLDLGIENVDCGRVLNQVGDRDGARFGLGESGELLVQFEEVPDPEAHQEGQRNECDDHDDAARTGVPA